MGRLNTFTFITAFLLLSTNNSFCQSNDFNKIPKEEIFVVINTDLFVVGETVFYKLFCLNKENNSLSKISKIAYVILVNDQREIIFEHKLKLNNGITNGDYYIPPNLKTGNYKLIFYTKWMNNNKEVPFYNLDIYIINPFSIENKETNVSNVSEKENIDSIRVKASNRLPLINIDNNIQLITNTDTYKTRSKVSLELKNRNRHEDSGNYSISVRKIDPIEIVKKHSNNYYKSSSIKKNNFSLPEIRGEIISGTILSKTNTLPIADIVVALSISENGNLFKNVKTNKFGKFYFNLYEDYKDGVLVIQVLDVNSENYKIVLDDFSFKYMDDLVFNQVKLNPNIKEWLLQKSISNQIESSFFDVKKDSILIKNMPEVFYGEASVEFLLDDYKRFSTLKETFIEVIKGAGIRKIKGKRKIVLFNPETELNSLLSSLETLALIDGIPIQNHEILLDYNVGKIEKVSIINEIYFYGPRIYNGILAFKTKQGDFSLPYSVPHKRMNIVSPLNNKKYFNQKYNASQNELSRIPDFRAQLLWMPNFNLNKESKEIEFYTSNVKGMFQIVLEGFTHRGRYIKQNKYFKVE